MKVLFGILFCLLGSSVVFAQGLLPYTDKNKQFTRQPVYTFTRLAGNGTKIEQAIPQNFYAQHIGFFCRQELKMQEAHIPVTFRLGSMNYCNYLEQKPGYR